MWPHRFQADASPAKHKQIASAKIKAVFIAISLAFREMNAANFKNIL
jgi:hypothetical protein